MTHSPINMLAAPPRVPLDWTNKGTQTSGTREYSPFMVSLRRTLLADIGLPKAAAARIAATRVEVVLCLRVNTII